VRLGSTNRRADMTLIGELRRYALGGSFDEEPMPGVDSEAVDFRVASECFAAVRTLRPEDLETLRLVTPHQGHQVATVGGMPIRTGPPTVDATDQLILDALVDGGRSTSELAAVVALSTRATRTRLVRLVGRGLVREIGSGASDPRRRYFRSI